MRTVRRGLWVASVAVLVAGSAVGDEPKKDPPRAPVVAPTKELLDKLLKAYRLYELPEPPADAPLVSFPIHAWTGERQLRALGFRLKPTKEGGPVRVLWNTGTIQELERREVAKPVEPRPGALTDIDSGLDGVFAARCHARGWTELALKVLEVDLSGKVWAPETNLAQSAWYHWLHEFRKPETDRAKVARLLKVIWESRREDFTVHDRNKLDALEASLLPGKGKPGTVEALIDGLIDVTHTDRTDALVQIHEPHPAYLKVARKGFDAVPALIEHLNDERLTRAYKQGFNNFRDYDYTVADVVCDLLQGLAGKDIGKDWLRRQQGYRLEKADVEKWWAEARPVGEEQYFLRHVLENERDDHWPNVLMVDVLAHKYPNHLPAIYRKILDDRPKMYASVVAKAVAKSSLPKETKRELFLRAAGAKEWHHRQDAIQHLGELDPKEGLKLLVATLKGFQLDRPDSDEAKEWSVNWLARQVVQAKDAQAWAALAEAADRWPVALQREAIGVMGNQADDEVARMERLRFLSRFLGSGGVWKTAARTAAEVLRLRKPNSEWTNQDWEDLVEDIRTTLAREGIR